MKTIMITGASGLVGSNLVKKAEESGMRVIPITREAYGDLTEMQSIEALPMADYIINSAGYGQPNKYMSNPIKTIQLNAMLTMKLFDHLYEGGKFLFISTSEVYSGLPNQVCSEEHIGTTNTYHPRACYIEGKRCGEAITLINKGKVVRLCLTYGPGTKKNDDRVMNQFIHKALFNKEIRLLDDGSAIRTYCYITDAIEMIWQAFMNGKESIYNVGSKSKTTILDMAKKVGLLMNVSVILPPDPKRLAGSPSDVCVDISRYESEFGKKEFVTIEEGLKRTIEYQKELYKCV